MSVKCKYTIRAVPYSDIKEWLIYKHYAKRLCSVTYCYGLFENSTLVGVCTFGSPASRPLCVGVCGSDNAHKVYELNRLCINEGMDKNVLSFFVSSCLRRLPNGLIIVSYADTSQGHHGYIYQATNWIYTGLSAKRTERYDVKNPNRHSKSVVENKNYKYDDLAVRQRPQKHRYIYFTGNKNNVRELRAKLNYTIEPYPKGDNKRYDSSYRPSMQTKLNLF